MNTLSVQKSSDLVAEQVVIEAGADSSDGDWMTSSLELPNIGMRSLYAASAKAAARLNAAVVRPEEVERLLLERQHLLDKMFDGTITRAEENRLSYVRWSLDRVEDAKHGAVLDALEAQVEQYEAFQSEIEKFYKQLNQKAQPRRR